MKQCVKRYLAVILTLAMVFTMIPSTLVRAEGEEGGVVGTTQTVKASKFVVSGGQSEANLNLIATNANGTDGTSVAAAYIRD